VLHKYSDLTFDPTRLFQLRNNEMIIVKQSKLAARLVTWFSDYQTLRNDSLSESSNMDFKTIMRISKDDNLI